MMGTVAFHTLGCKVNHYETEAIWQLFKEAGYERKSMNQKQTYMSLIHVRSRIQAIRKAAKSLEEPFAITRMVSFV
ncbi:hypothetical protein BsIDN1_44480 [Bacillus safensis]|uniref:MTTase N-terminal domain-containing protein n=1 Tax=Bacillus safensis TaxID=561879 RepID=A0A5S9MBD1_BACIA|nr:hypothetical protein BsIDN1_44480 [Bacillus safensis]